ncbi:sodium channel and clathrin linker 1 [Spea bombifrons]|uniref:sodium channel and clathrin linker 1 n=1 Tax=Spea bombifrons TaxID=233779 RepID=UPI00234A4FD3|nr:sodium channel and clathrin linker 1 [Spea bombifrons]
MAALEMDFLRDEVQRLRTALKQYEEQNTGSPVLRDETSHTASEKRNMDLLMGEFDAHTEEMSKQLHFYQAQMGEMRLKLESIVKENERLHEQLKESLEQQLDSSPSGAGLAREVFTEHEVIKNLQEQLKLANQEKDHALELWHTATQEMDHLQQLYQAQLTQTQVQAAEKRQQKTNQQILLTVKEQSLEIQQLSTELRQTKVDLSAANMKIDEMNKLIGNLQEQLQRKEEEILATQNKEEASDKRARELQSSLTQLETRLKLTTQNEEQLKRERAELEKHVAELQTKYSEIEEQKYEAVGRLRETTRVLEEVALQKDQALLREKQKEEGIENIKQAMAQIIQDAAIKTRREVEKARKHSNVQISRLTEDITALQMECGEKQSQIERALREKRAIEEELEKLYRESQMSEKDHRKVEELHQRCLIAERAKDDLQISLHTTQNKLKRLELNSTEELSRSQETIQKLNKILETERVNYSSLSEDRLKLLQENEQLMKEVEEWKKSSMDAQQKITFQVQTLAYEFSAKEQGFEVHLKEVEERNQKSVNDLMKLLETQQKTTNRWKAEAQKLAENTEKRILNLRSQLNHQKKCNGELLSQIESAHEKNLELQKLLTEYQEKSNRLQSRLKETEQIALSATKQFKLLASQKRKSPFSSDP